MCGRKSCARRALLSGTPESRYLFAEKILNLSARDAPGQKGFRSPQEIMYNACVLVVGEIIFTFSSPRNFHHFNISRASSCSVLVFCAFATNSCNDRFHGSQ